MRASRGAAVERGCAARSAALQLLVVQRALCRGFCCPRGVVSKLTTAWIPRSWTSPTRPRCNPCDRFQRPPPKSCLHRLSDEHCVAGHHHHPAGVGCCVSVIKIIATSIGDRFPKQHGAPRCLRYCPWRRRKRTFPRRMTTFRPRACPDS